MLAVLPPMLIRTVDDQEVGMFVSPFECTLNTIGFGLSTKRCDEKALGIKCGLEVLASESQLKRQMRADLQLL